MGRGEKAIFFLIFEWTACFHHQFLFHIGQGGFLVLTWSSWDCHGVMESEGEVTQSCLTLCDPMGCSLPGSSVHGIFQARVLEWVAIMSQKAITHGWGFSKSAEVLVYCHLLLIFLFLVHTKEHVLGTINLLSSLGRMWVSYQHCFII